MKRKLLTSIVSLAMVVAMAPGIGAADASDDERIIGAIDTPDGVELITESDLPMIESNHRLDCGGDAPLEHYCSNGDHPRELGIRHGCLTLGTDYTGTVESRVIGEDDTRLFACIYEDGELIETAGEGAWPSVSNDEFHHDCYSYLQDTAYLLYFEEFGVDQEQPTGIPGGLGEWGCFVEPPA